MTGLDFEPLNSDDLSIVRTQLDRDPDRVVGIARRCPQGHPSVVVNYPARRSGGRLVPFPTLFWLTCPELVKQVSRVEMAGRIDELDARLEQDHAFAAAVDRDHETYIALRWELLEPGDRSELESAGLTAPFLQRGIGGIENRKSVKCLHLHFAHHLATANTIGALLAAEHEIRPCAS